MMSERDYAPLSAACVRSLNDKIYEKRKAAALEIENKNIKVTVEFLTEIDKLIQLIQSPIFTYLRLQLLSREDNIDIIYVLYGLLMILLQSEAYTTLQRRLSAIPPATKSLSQKNRRISNKQ
ncbi:hypothetical protein M0802_001624 [Mischocyttarus mexicanus]|nr:hypothetical protein M0802_001624 [Mischocyttarus mexicanus]